MKSHFDDFTSGKVEKYDLAGRRIVKIGVSFSSEKRTIVDVKQR